MNQIPTQPEERRLRAAARLYRKGRERVLWVNGVVYFGGSLFLLYNAVDYLIEPHSRPNPVELLWLVGALVASGLLGYLYGLFTWRNLARTFADPGDSNHQNVQ
jgi:hypothetical protein